MKAEQQPTPDPTASAGPTRSRSYARAPAPAGSARATPMWRRYAAFLRVPPELTLAWRDAETGARAWLVINSLRGGAAGGGTRMRHGLHAREVMYLAKTMELKFAISGPPIGGAKTGIAFDAADPRRTGVLERWYRAVKPLLRERYGTGGDLNIDEVRDVLPAFERIGLRHPQEGVVRGHLRPDATTFLEVMERLEHGVEATVPDGVDGGPFTIADTITGFGLAVAVQRLYERRGRGLDGVRVLLEGFGNVGAAAGLHLARRGARIVGIRDARRTCIDPGGIDASAMTELIRRRTDKLLPADDPRVQLDPECSRFQSTAAEVFVCAAVSESLTPGLLDVLGARGVRVIACGANQPFREVKVGSTRVARHADRRFAILADVLANCGMARTFSYLMEPTAQPRAEPIFHAVHDTIRDTLDDVLDRAAGAEHGLLSATLGLALDRIGARA